MRILFFVVLILVGACSKKEDNLTLLQVSEQIKAFAPEMMTVLGKDMDAGISCSSYGPHCVSARKMIIRKVDLGAIEFKTQENARQVAEQLGQNYLKNWFLDDYAGEPVLE